MRIAYWACGWRGGRQRDLVAGHIYALFGSQEGETAPRFLGMTGQRSSKRHLNAGGFWKGDRKLRGSQRVGEFRESFVSVQLVKLRWLSGCLKLHGEVPGGVQCTFISDRHYVSRAQVGTPLRNLR
jgi:hypothetical protein